MANLVTMVLLVYVVAMVLLVPRVLPENLVNPV